MDDASKDRVVKNEALFRDVNERIKEIDESHGIGTAERWDFICECGDETCFERISMTKAQYERLRSRPIQFSVVPGHEIPEVERVILRDDDFVVVEKDLGERRIARERAERDAESRES